MPLDSLLSVALGLGLAAAAGFRAFLPLLVAAIAARLELLPLSESFEWLASTPALITLGAAAVFEALAYYIPGVDHLLDLLAGPIAVAAGVVASASVMVDVPAAVGWPVALILGGGLAGATKDGTALVRAKTGVATAGLGNPVVSTAENASAVGLSILAIALPLVCLAAVIALFAWAARKLWRMRRRTA
jgi:hypothetical protein